MSDGTIQLERIQLTLPGLELQGDEYGQPSALRSAVKAQLVALEEEGLLKPKHTAFAQLALELADAVVSGTRKGRASAVAMAAAQLRETLLALPTGDTSDGEAERFAAFVEGLKAGSASQRQVAA